MRCYTYDELLQCSWCPTISEERALLITFREPKTLYKEENLWRKLSLVNKVSKQMVRIDF